MPVASACTYRANNVKHTNILNFRFCVALVNSGEQFCPSCPLPFGQDILVLLPPPDNKLVFFVMYIVHAVQIQNTEAKLLRKYCIKILHYSKFTSKLLYQAVYY